MTLGQSIWHTTQNYHRGHSILMSFFSFVREYIEKGLVKILFVRFEEYYADIGSKNTKESTFAQHKSTYMDHMIQNKK